MLAIVVAEEFGIPPSDVVIRIGDTRFPIGPDSGGSVTTGSISPAARNAAYQAKQQFFAAIAPQFGTTPDNLDLARRPLGAEERCVALIHVEAGRSKASDGGNFGESDAGA